MIYEGPDVFDRCSFDGVDHQHALDEAYKGLLADDVGPTIIEATQF